MSKPWHDEDWLREMYWGRGLSTREIGRVVGCDGKTIHAAMKRLGVPTRNRKLGGADTYKDAAWLRRKYMDEQMSCEAIAALVGRSRATIQNWLNYHEIKPRESGEAAWIARKKKWEPNDTYQDEDWLRARYDGGGMSTTEIAEICDTCAKTICNWLERFGIEIRGAGSGAARDWEPGGIHYERVREGNKPYQDQEWLKARYRGDKMALAEMAALVGVHKTVIEYWMEKYGIERRGNEGHYEKKLYHDPDWLRQKYINEQLTTRQIADLANTHSTTISTWLGKFGIPARDKQESVTIAWERGAYDGRSMVISPTGIEIAVSEALDALRITHVAQHRPDGCTFVYDEFVPPDILVEVNGDYWHGPDWPENQARDAQKELWALENDYRFVVIWEGEIMERGAKALIQERVA